jgi:tetratricopeptide (TPR) repeat protein
VAAYRQSVALDDRALRLDPNSLRAKRGLSICQMKIGSVELDTDPAEALKDFQLAFERADALPQGEQGSLFMMRLRSVLLRKQANALEQLGAYAQAAPLFRKTIDILQGIAAQDSKDLRALYDVVTALDDEARSYEDAANPVVAAQPGERREYLILAEKTLAQSAADLERLLRQDPANETWQALLGNTRVRIGSVRSALHAPGTSDELSRQGLAALWQVAEKDQASPLVLDQAANAFLTVEPTALRDPGFALACAQREVAMSHGKTPFRLLTLAQAYRAAGQIDNARATAKEGLALLPTPPPGSAKANIRKLLENEAQARF